MGVGTSRFTGWTNSQATFKVELAVDILVAGGTYYRYTFERTLIITDPCTEGNNIKIEPKFPTQRATYHHPYTGESRPVFFEYMDFDEDGTTKLRQYISPYVDSHTPMRNTALNELIPKEACDDDILNYAHFRWRSQSNQLLLTDSDYDDLKWEDEVSNTDYKFEADDCLFDKRVNTNVIDYLSIMCGHKDMYPIQDPGGSNSYDWRYPRYIDFALKARTIRHMQSAKYMELKFVQRVWREEGTALWFLSRDSDVNGASTTMRIAYKPLSMQKRDEPLKKWKEGESIYLYIPPQNVYLRDFHKEEDYWDDMYEDYYSLEYGPQSDSTYTLSWHADTSVVVVTETVALIEKKRVDSNLYRYELTTPNSGSGALHDIEQGLTWQWDDPQMDAAYTDHGISKHQLRDWFKIEITNFVNPPSTRRVDYGWKAKIEDEDTGEFYETGLYNMLNANMRSETAENAYKHTGGTNYYYYYASFHWRTQDTLIGKSSKKRRYYRPQSDILTPPGTIAPAAVALSVTMPSSSKYAGTSAPWFKVTFTTSNSMPYDDGWIYFVYPAELTFSSDSDFEVEVSADTANPGVGKLSKEAYSGTLRFTGASGDLIPDAATRTIKLRRLIKTTDFDSSEVPANMAF